MPSRTFVALKFGVLAVTALSLFTMGAVSAQEQPGGPPEARNCTIGIGNGIETGELPAPEHFTASLDEARRVVILTIGAVSPKATCFSIWKLPSPENPIAFEWDEIAVTVPSELIDDAGFFAAGRTCYLLFIGNATAHSTQVERCVDIPMSLVATREPGQQTPTPEGSEEPEGPPPEAVNCVRPSNVTSDLEAPADFNVALDVDRKLAKLTIGAVSGRATCFSVFKTPSGVNPIAFAWDELSVEVPGELFDITGFESSGRYCYTLVIGNATGYLVSAERCIDVPTTVAPPPEPTPNFPTPVAPGVGSGSVDPSSSWAPLWGVAVSIGAVTSLLALAVVAKINRAS